MNVNISDFERHDPQEGTSGAIQEPSSTDCNRVKGEGRQSQLSFVLYHYIALMQHVSAEVRNAIIWRN